MKNLWEFVPEAGVEPARPQWTQDFKSGASTDSATQALISGAENETRTRDPDLGKVVLYQLSYFRLTSSVGFLSRLGNAQASLVLRSLLQEVRNESCKICGFSSRLGRIKASFASALAAPRIPQTF